MAVKCLHNNIVDNKSKNPLGDILNEASSMCGLEHEHLIKLYGVLFNTNQQDLNTKLMMVTEYARYGSLQNYLRDHRKSHHSAYLPVKQLFSYVYQIACGMEYLESKKLVHRDLAARNILLYTLEHIKICDFGMTRSVKSSKLNDSRDNDEDDDDKMYAMNDLEKIPCAWYPPESIREHLFSIKSDVWAFGVCIWEIFTECEKQPWPGMNAFQILYKLEIEKARLEQPYLCSSSFYKLVLKCWSYSPSDRPTFRQLKNLIKGFLFYRSFPYNRMSFHFTFKDIKIVEMKAKLSFTEENKLAIEVGDLITIVDGTPDKYWWKGQNQRSMLVGQFPRALLDPQRPVSKEDISGPLRNSFIHTGHMSSNPSDPKSWGDPGKIDEIFLKNPLSPPDFFVGGDQPELTLDITESVSKPSALSHQTSNDCLTNMLNDINLIDFTEDVMIANDIQITHPNYLSADDTVSSNSFESSQSSPSFPRYFNQQHITKEWQIVTSPTSNVYYNQISNQYLEPVSSTTSQSSTTQCHQPKTLHTSQSFIQPTMARNLSSIGLEKQLHRTISSHIDERSYVNILPTKTEQTPPVQRFSAHDFESPKQPVSVDDLLNKVMRDVLSDLDTIKIKPVK